MHQDNQSEFVGKEPCPACGSRDNLARYSDGHGFCFGCEHYEPGDGSSAATRPRKGKRMSDDLLPAGEFRPIKGRAINEETARHYGYYYGTMSGKTVQVAPYYDYDGNLVAQHIRTRDKEFPWVGDPKSAMMFGQNLWRDGGKMVVVTEGELDAMSVSQAQNNKYPVVSIGCGASKPGHEAKVTKYLARHAEWLEKFDSVIFWFDNDEQGRASAIAAASTLTPGKAKLATTPGGHKDANDLLQAGKIREIIDTIWGAKEYRPDGLVTLEDLEDQVMQPVEWGMPYPWRSLTMATYGRQPGEVIVLGAGTGVGKTDVFTQMISHDISDLRQPVGLFYLEQPPVETLKRIAGKLAGQRFHVPDAGWTNEDLVSAINAMKAGGRLYLYDNFGATDWDVIAQRISFLAQSEGVRLFYIDHLTALAAAADDERTALEHITAEVAMLAKRLGVTIHMISHLATPEGKPHEEGGRVMIRHFKGSRSIGYWAHFMFGLERDQQAEDEMERKTTTFRILKDRKTGQGTGTVFYLMYDEESGLLKESIPADNPFETEEVADAPADF
jgi:twinkle protein